MCRMMLKSFTITVFLTVFSLSVGSQEIISKVNKVNPKRIMRYQKELTAQLSHYNWLHVSALLVTGAMSIYGLCNFGAQAYPMLVNIKRWLMSEEYLTFCTGACKSIEHLGQGYWKEFGAMIAIGMAQSVGAQALDDIISPYTHRQTLSWYLLNKNNCFGSLHAVQLAVIILRNAGQFDQSEKNSVCCAVNNLVNKIEHLIAYMRCGAVKEKEAKVFAICDVIKDKTDLLVQKVENLLNKYPHDALYKEVKKFRQELLLELGNFAEIEGSSVLWQQFVYACADRLLVEQDNDYAPWVG